MIASVAVCGPWCGSASAGTAQVEHDTFTAPEPHGGLIEHHVGRIVYTADPGERNDITMTGLDDGAAEVHDAGAPVAAGAGCERLGEHDARCTAPEEGVTGLVHAGDGD